MSQRCLASRFSSTVMDRTIGRSITYVQHIKYNKNTWWDTGAYKDAIGKQIQWTSIGHFRNKELIEERKEYTSTDKIHDIYKIIFDPMPNSKLEDSRIQTIWKFKQYKGWRGGWGGDGGWGWLGVMSVNLSGVEVDITTSGGEILRVRLQFFVESSLKDCMTFKQFKSFR